MSRSKSSEVLPYRGAPGLLFLLVLLPCLALFYSGGTLAARGGVGGGGGGGFAVAGGVPPPMPRPFDITGFLQEATLDTAGSICQASDPRLAGGTLKVNNIRVIVPCNTILQMPASTLTWQEVFSLAPRDIGLPLDANGIPTQTGLALADKVKLPVATPYNGPLPSYEVHVQGNIVDGQYIAGLLFLSQQNMNLAQGIITAIDYDNGELKIATKGLHPGVARVKINDPLGRYGLAHGAPGSTAPLVEPGYDQRFSIDEDSPTVHAVTGFPMCIPRSDPFAVADDPDCPQANRPRSPLCAALSSPFPAFAMPPGGQYCTSYMMPPATGIPCVTAIGVVCPPDPTRQVPFEVGDFIDYMGTLKVDSKGAYISAHTLVGHLAVYTTPGTMPAYLTIEMELQGTGALPVGNVTQEVTTRIKVEGFSTDPSALVDIYAVDVDPLSGAISDRLLGAANPSGPPVVGRFRFLPFSGAFLPPPREFRVVSRTLCAAPNQPCLLSGNAATYANGIVAGQYHAPNFEFIFPEILTLGDAPIPANFQDLLFLFCGSGPLGTPTGGGNAPLVGQLDPPPWDAPMYSPFFSGLCPSARLVGAAVQAPVVGTPVPVVPPPATPTPPLGTPLTTPVVAPITTPVTTPVSTPIAVAGLLTALGTSVAPNAVPGDPAAVDPAAAPPADAANNTPPADAQAPQVSVIAMPDVVSEAEQTVVLSAAASDPNTPTRPLTYTWTQIGYPAVAIGNATRETATFVAPSVSTATTLTFNVAVRNTVPLTTNATVTVLVKPLAPPPSVSFTVPASVLAGTRVPMNGLVSGGASFAWKQTAGPSVALNNETTLKPDFIAPPGPTSLSFALTATNVAGTSATATRNVQVIADDVTVGAVTWNNRQGRGRLTVVATSSAISPTSPAPPAGMSMTATFWNQTLPSSAAGSESHPIALPMSLVRNVPGQEPVCSGALPCFVANPERVIPDPASPPSSPSFLAPTTVVVKSSLGGKAGVSGEKILQR